MTPPLPRQSPLIPPPALSAPQTRSSWFRWVFTAIQASGALWTLWGPPGIIWGLTSWAAADALILGAAAGWRLGRARGQHHAGRAAQ